MIEDRLYQAAMWMLIVAMFLLLLVSVLVVTDFFGITDLSILSDCKTEDKP